MLSSGDASHGPLPLPASETKHLSELKYRLPRLDCTLSLKQVAGDGTTTGSTLWLSSQILACYLQSKYDRRQGRTRSDDGSGAALSTNNGGIQQTLPTPPPRAIDLGAGVGLTSLVLERLGWRVAATDVAPPLETVLQPNVSHNSLGGVQVAALDWLSFGCAAAPTQVELEPPELVVTADTVYEPALVDGLFRTISFLLSRGRMGNGDSGLAACATTSIDSSRTDCVGLVSAVPVGRRTAGHRQQRHALIALERRDSKLVDDALACAREKHRLLLQRISVRQVRRAVDEYMTDQTTRRPSLAWPREAWDDVEIWRADLAEATFE